MIHRTLQDKIKALSRQYPVVTLTGPRQSGKTTLCKAAFPEWRYVSLEDPAARRQAQSDPKQFLEKYNDKVIIDEAQRFPELTSYLQPHLDEAGREGMYILTGSQNLALHKAVSQSLAGRTALLTLLPFSYEEAYGRERKGINAVLYRGFYPRVIDKKLNPTEFYSFYFQTYIERDVRDLLRIKDLSSFQQFVTLCAANTGQILNLSRLGTECSISHNTAKSWLSILEASYIITLLRPFHKNFRKRIVKAPKLYFNDTGLACFLLGIHHDDHLDKHPLKGSLFETFVVAELLKYKLHHARNMNLYYFRDNTGNEVDVILDLGSTIVPVEIKSGQTVSSDYYKGLRFIEKITPKNFAANRVVIYGGKEQFTENGIDVIPYHKLNSPRLFTE